MPGNILHLGATVQCAHAGSATPTVTSTRVFVGGQPIATVPGPYAVAGCTLPPNAGGPCATGNWTTGATRVTSMGAPVIINTGQATCVPTGTPLLPTVFQTRVIAT
ncbi:MAG TPA: hypothetical protein VHG93_16005 [Longimicrobium sp.]|nr:hypothetical protein [Longimicrobium sp.]